MAVYTIHLPPPDADGVSDADRFRLIRDGLAPLAMIFWPFWFFAKRLWLGALAVYAIWAAMNLGFFAAGLPAAVIALGWAAFLLLVGLEAHSVERWTLARRGWREAGVTVAGNAAEAEARAIVALTQSGLPAMPEEPTRSGWFARRRPRTALPAADGQVLGLFPEPRR